jgi:hypothetical protein
MFSHFSNNYHYNYDYQFDNMKEDNPFLNRGIDPNDTCLICLETESEKYALSKLSIILIKKCNCDGIFHDKCVKKWNNSKHACPICRIDINEKFTIEPNEYIHFLTKLYTISEVSLRILSTIIILSMSINVILVISLDIFGVNNRENII